MLLITRLTFALVATVTALPFAAQARAHLDPGRDYHSHANTKQFLVEHAVLDLNVDFERQELRGEVRLRFKRVEPGARELVLDTRDLKIQEVALIRPAGGAQSLKYRVGKSDPVLGAPLHITLPQELGGDHHELRVRYTTSPQASGLQWVQPEQTAGRKHPFLYSQSQAIHARSWIPLQDTPAVRLTYVARIRTPRTLRAVMSAANDPNEARDGDYSFEMPQPVPSYLMALAVGDLHFQAIGPRTGVYAEPVLLQSAAREFADVESMLSTCERLFGPYRWGRYDLLILPPSFMWGGMENPRLSFITPTVIAGDKSLTALIAHELAHSWSGNLVTNATWRDIWLNEGFTVYLERRIIEVLYGNRRRAMEDVLGLQSLRRDMTRLIEDAQPDLTHLAMDVRGRDPDVAFSDVAYEKGRLFIGFLESRVGRDRLDAFLRKYFDTFSFQSIHTERFRDYLNEHLIEPTGNALTLQEVDAWVYGPELPRTAVLPNSDAFIQIDAQVKHWLSGEPPQSALATKQWSTHEWLYFLDNLPSTVTRSHLSQLDEAFSLTGAKNSEIAHSWLRNVIRLDFEPAYPRLEEYLTSIGRRKLVRDLYEDLMKTPEGASRARQIYAKARPMYHVVLRTQLDEIVQEDAG